MKTLRYISPYTLIYNPDSENTSLRYHIDNGEEVSEYFDEIEANDLLQLSNEDFVNECKAYF